MICSVHVTPLINTMDSPPLQKCAVHRVSTAVILLPAECAQSKESNERSRTAMNTHKHFEKVLNLRNSKKTQEKLDEYIVNIKGEQ